MISLKCGILSLFYAFCSAQYLTTPYEENNPNPDVDSFDFIIGGPTGIILATRLVEHPRNFSVLLLEAGPDPNLNTTIPLYEGEPLAHSETNWEYLSVPQKRSAFGTKDRRISIGQGKELGGSTSHNGMIVIRGNYRDYDKWAELTGDSSWSYDSLLPYFTKIENYRGSFAKSSDHGYNGPLEIIDQSSSYSPLYKEWVDTGKSLKFNYTDPNTRDQQSGFWDTQVNIGSIRSQRSSVYEHYLLPHLGRPNFKVLRHAYVLKVNLDASNTAKSVTFLRHWQKITINATKEIILSAGSFKSPQILMLSGIGDKEHLTSVGVPTKVHSPGVGAELWDHPTVIVGPFVLDKPTGNGLTYLPTRDLTPEAVAQYAAHGKGPLASSLWSGYGLWSTTGNHSFPNIIFEQWAEGGNGVIQLRSDLLGAKTHGKLVQTTDAVSVVVSLGIPRSHGTLRLESSDPFDQPLIDFNFFADEGGQDFNELVVATKFIVDFYENSKFYQKYGVKLLGEKFPGCEKHEFKSDGYYRCYVEQLSSTGIHPSGTVKMGKVGDPMAVLDSKLKVRGVSGLRVADSSVMPHIINTNIQIACMTIGEKVADLVIKDWVK